MARVQKGRFLGLTGPMGRRVLKFDGAFGPEGCGGGWRRKFYKKGARLAPRVVKGKVLKMDGPSAQGFLSLTAFQAEGCGIARRAISIIMPPFGGHVHIEYHNHSYHRPPLRHFVALFP